MAIANNYPMGTPKSDDLLIGTSVPAANSEDVATTRNFSIYRLSKDKHIYFWAELITLEKESYWTCGFHTDSRANLMGIILSYKVFLRKIQKKIHLPVIGLINKRNIFMKKLNKDIGFQEINKKDKKKFTTIKNYYKIKNTNNYIFFKL